MFCFFKVRFSPQNFLLIPCWSNNIHQFLEGAGGGAMNNNTDIAQGPVFQLSRLLKFTRNQVVYSQKSERKISSYIVFFVALKTPLPLLWHKSTCKCIFYVFEVVGILKKTVHICDINTRTYTYIFLNKSNKLWCYICAKLTNEWHTAATTQGDRK